MRSAACSKRFARKTNRFTIASSTYALAYIFGCSSVAAQSIEPAPVRSTVDPNGVDLYSGSLHADGPALTIGTTGSSLNYHVWTAGGGISDSLWNSLIISGSSATVSIGEHSDGFSVSGSTYTSTEGNGSTLVTGGPGLQYTDRTGAVYTFTTFTGNYWLPYGGSYRLTSIKLPNGEVQTYSWTSGTYCELTKSGECIYSVTAWRVANVTSSNGFELVPTYSTNTLTYSVSSGANTTAWSSINSVAGYNLAVSNSTPVSTQTLATTASGSNGYYVVTDSAGNSYTYQAYNYISGDPARFFPIKGIQTPASSAQNVVVGYNSSNLVSSVTNASGTTTYARSTTGTNLTVTATDALSHVSTYLFDTTSQRLLTYTDPLGNATTYQHDSYGRYTQTTLPEGDNAQTTYDARGNITKLTRVAKAGSGLANIALAAAYDASCANAVKCNQANWAQDALGNETDYTYDPTSGLLTSTTSPAATSGGVRPQARLSYTQMQAYYLNTSGSIVASGVNTYKVTGTSTCRTEAGATLVGTEGGTGQFSLSGTATCAGSSDETKSTTSFGPQVAGTANNLWPVSQSLAAGDGSLSGTTSQTYDSYGDVITATGPLGAGQVTYKFYDADRHLTGTIAPDPDGSGSRTPAAAQYTYNADGALLKTSIGTVPNQASSMTGYAESYNTNSTLDAFDRPIRTNVLNGTTAYAVSDQLYDAAGRPWCSIQYMNMAAVPTTIATTSCSPYQTTGPYGPDRIAQTTFDADSRVLTKADGVGTLLTNGTSATNAYSPDGNLNSVTDGNNNQTAYTYDGFNRLSQVNFPLATKGSNASDPGNYEAFTFDADSHLLTRRLRDANTLTFTYDNLGRLATRTPGGSSPISSNDYPVNYSYNLVGGMIQIARPTDGETLSYTYDALGRVTNETQPFGSLTYQYDAAGDRTQITWADGFYATYDYDTIGGVTSITANGATSGVGVLASYTYDNLGRRTGVAYGNGTSKAYAFDPVSRLAGLQLAFPVTTNNELIGGVAGSGTPISYAPSSQIASITRSNDAYAWTSAYNVSRTYTANGLNQYTSSGGVTLAYDARGDLASSTPSSGGATTYSYTKLNELVSVPGTATIYYDPLSRVSEYDTSASTRFYYSGGTAVAEVANPSGTVTQRYVPGPGTDEIVAWYSGTGNTTAPQFLQTDERGSVIAVTNSAGALVAANSYDEYGIPASTNVGRFGYTGQTWFPEVGLYNYKARWYSPGLGRFMQTDPIGYVDGLNWYNYTHGDPINGGDSSGMTAVYDPFGDGAGDGMDSCVSCWSTPGGAYQSPQGQITLTDATVMEVGTGDSNDQYDGDASVAPSPSAAVEAASLSTGISSIEVSENPVALQDSSTSNSDEIIVTAQKSSVYMTQLSDIDYSNDYFQLASNYTSGLPRNPSCTGFAYMCLSQQNMTPLRRQNCQDAEKICNARSYFQNNKPANDSPITIYNLCVGKVCYTILPFGGVRVYTKM